MTPADALPPERRKARTREAVLEAMRQLLLTRRYGAIRAGELIARADVGRSTFYEHFRSKDEVLAALIDPLFSPLADAAAGRGNVHAVEAALAHLWEQRAAARGLLEAPPGPRLARKLAGMIAERLGDRTTEAPPALAAAGAAAATLAMLRAWLAGEAACRPVDLAREMVGLRRGPG